MIITWDEPKRLANIHNHGMDFVDLDSTFFATAFVGAAKHRRLFAVGRTANGAITVIFGRLGREGISVISMRPASRKERKLIDG